MDKRFGALPTRTLGWVVVDFGAPLTEEDKAEGAIGHIVDVCGEDSAKAERIAAQKNDQE